MKHTQWTTIAGFIVGLALGWTTVPSNQAVAGLLVGGGSHWKSFSVRPKGEESTYNYQGFGVDAQIGYSAAQAVDFSLGASFTPVRPGSATVVKSNARVIEYNGILGVTILKGIYLGVQGGLTKFVNHRPVHEDEAVAGEWLGSNAGFSMAAARRFHKEGYVRIGILLSSATLVHDNLPEEDQKRNFDFIGIYFNVLFNAKSAFGSSRLFNSFFG